MNNMENADNGNNISVRSVQHFLYCPHRWGLMEIDRAWAENYFVVKANIVHERAHTNAQYVSRGKKVYTAVKIWNDDYGLFGVTDCLEVQKGKYTIVEYKPTAPKKGIVREEDAMQIFAQKVCVDNVLATDCAAEIYYADTKKRYALPFAEQYAVYEEKLRKILQVMRGYLASGQIPAIRQKQVCSGCSMKDLCLPSAGKKQASLRASIAKFAEGEP
jgi:CRISPR-associated exonuclease Cas4